MINIQHVILIVATCFSNKLVIPNHILPYLGPRVCLAKAGFNPLWNPCCFLRSHAVNENFIQIIKLPTDQSAFFTEANMFLYPVYTVLITKLIRSTDSRRVFVNVYC